MNGIAHIKRLVPPESIGRKVENSKCERHDLKFGDGQMFNTACDALEYEPARMNDDKPFSQPIAFTSVLDFILGDLGEVDFFFVR